MNRRQFLGTTITGLAAARLARPADAKKLKLGLIGCGWYGLVNVNAAFKVGGVEVLAICDVDSQHLKDAADKIAKLQGARPKTFKLYEEMLAVPGLDAVIIATPPQWHALPFIAALARNLDIYCEKPLAYDIREGRAMVDAAKRKPGCIVQIGFQRRQSRAIQQARDYIQAGNAGRIVHVDAQIHYTAGIKDTTPQDPPASLDWDLWCGPAPKLPYCPQIGHFAWRLEKEYGNGHLVDWGIHLIDATRVILGETMPRTVQAAGGIYQLKGKITTPDILTAHWEFAQCPVTWRHRIWGAAEYAPEVDNGIFFYGEKETLFVTDNKWIVIPKDKKAERKVNEVKSDAGVQHMADFLEAVRTRRAPACQPEDAFHSAATVQLAMIAYQAGAKLVWDAQAEQIVGHDAAAKLLKRDYRAPWNHPWKG
ncbi:MAG: Gfo/Idh/MocA family oxidoreductase [Verrucomicrobiae bacterium]|nr:Gfo/Idh/MocA family oxidoreductase [Verrucomicrobiae bacterium]